MATLRLSPNVMVKVKHLMPQDGRFYYQRRVPADLQARIGRTVIKRPLQAIDKAAAIREVSQHAASDDALWRALRAHEGLVPAEIQQAALSLLAGHGLEAGMGTAHPATDTFVDAVVEDARVSHDEYDLNRVDPVRRAAFDALKRAPVELLSTALRYYLDDHRKSHDSEFVRVTKRDWTQMVEIVGDIPLDKFGREQARLVRDKLLESQRTTSVRRRLNTLRAIFASIRRETNSHSINPFESVAIAGLGEDSQRRQPFSEQQLRKVITTCRSIDDERRRLISLLAYTGMRLGEAVGLVMSDLVLEHEVPHVQVREHPWRSLKTAQSARVIPLVGDALTVAKALKADAMTGQQFCFPAYCNDDGARSNAASAALNQWLRNLIDEPGFTCHSFRHTMRDRMREAGTPRDVIDAIGGWSHDNVGESYGKGHGLQMKVKYMQLAYASVAMVETIDR
jgi:integrase